MPSLGSGSLSLQIAVPALRELKGAFQGFSGCRGGQQQFATQTFRVHLLVIDKGEEAHCER